MPDPVEHEYRGLMLGSFFDTNNANDTFKMSTTGINFNSLFKKIQINSCNKFTVKMVENRILSLGTKGHRNYGTEAKNMENEAENESQASKESSAEEARKVPSHLLPFKDAKTKIFASGKPDRVLLL